MLIKDLPGGSVGSLADFDDLWAQLSTLDLFVRASITKNKHELVSGAIHFRNGWKRD